MVQGGESFRIGQVLEFPPYFHFCLTNDDCDHTGAASGDYYESYYSKK